MQQFARRFGRDPLLMLPISRALWRRNPLRNSTVPIVVTMSQGALLKGIVSMTRDFFGFQRATA